MSCTTVCSYQLLKENCLNAPELLFNKFRNFVNCLANYRFCSRIFFSLTKIRRKIALCLSELSLDTPWNFTRTFVRIFVEKSREQRTKFAHFACVTFAQYVGYKQGSWFLTVPCQIQWADLMPVKLKMIEFDYAVNSWILCHRVMSQLTFWMWIRILL